MVFMIHIILISKASLINTQKQPSRGVLIKRCSENMQQIYKRTPMPKCDFNKSWVNSPVNLLHIFRTTFPKNTSPPFEHFFNINGVLEKAPKAFKDFRAPFMKSSCTQLTFTCSKSTIGISEKGVRYVQS